METTEEEAQERPAGPRRLVRSRRDRMLGGVCGGVAEHTRLDPTLVRLGAVALVLLAGSGFLIYAIAWAVIPDAAPRPDDPPPRWPVLDRVPPVLLIGLGVVGVIVLFDNGGIPSLPIFPIGLLAIGALLVWEGRSAVDDDEVEVAELPAASPPPPAAPPSAPPHRRRRRRGHSFTIGLGTSVAALGVVFLAIVMSDDISPRILTGVVLAAVGGAVAFGAQLTNTRPLVPAALVLFGAVALWSAIDVPLTGGIGERIEPVVRADQFPVTERLAIGELTVDLREIDGLRDGARYEVEASVAIGELVVFVPDDVSLIIETDVQAGEIEIGEESAEGTSIDLDREFLEPEAPTLVLDLDVGLGHLEVVQGVN